MLKTCSYCGRVHDSAYVCPKKREATNRYPKNTLAARTRSLSRWQKTRDYIKRRDHGVCQLCLRNYTAGDIATLRPYEDEDIEVHHITSIEDDADKAFDEYNLISLCRFHHELAEKGAIPKRVLFEIAKENADAGT